MAVLVQELRGNKEKNRISDGRIKGTEEIVKEGKYCVEKTR